MRCLECDSRTSGYVPVRVDGVWQLGVAVDHKRVYCLACCVVAVSDREEMEMAR